MTFKELHVKSDMWRVTSEECHVKSAMWKVTCEELHVKSDMWKVTCEELPINKSDDYLWSVLSTDMEKGMDARIEGL